jgi:hypothetical protein
MFFHNLGKGERRGKADARGWTINITCKKK